MTTREEDEAFLDAMAQDEEPEANVGETLAAMGVGVSEGDDPMAPDKIAEALGASVVEPSRGIQSFLEGQKRARAQARIKRETRPRTALEIVRLARWALKGNVLSRLSDLHENLVSREIAHDKKTQHMGNLKTTVDMLKTAEKELTRLLGLMLVDEEDGEADL